MTGISNGRAYGINFLFAPETTRSDGQFPDPISQVPQRYDVEVSVNKRVLFRKSYKGDDL